MHDGGFAIPEISVPTVDKQPRGFEASARFLSIIGFPDGTWLAVGGPLRLQNVEIKLSRARALWAVSVLRLSAPLLLFPRSFFYPQILFLVKALCCRLSAGHQRAVESVLIQEGKDWAF